MADTKTSLAERLLDRVLLWLRDNRLPFLSSLIAGLLAHLYVMTNQLPNHDGIKYFFGKGITVSSGRWGLELLRLFIPDYTLPWLHGIVSLLLMSVAICLIVRLFGLRNRLSQILLPALIICFPSQIGVFCYLFTSSCYAVSFLLAVLAVAAARLPGWRKLWSIPCLLLSLSIYQAYLALTASLMILLLVKDLLDAGAEPAAKKVFLAGLIDLGLLLASLAFYALSIRVSLSLWHVDANNYTNEALEGGAGLVSGIVTAYCMFLYNLTSRYNMLIVSKFSRLLHFLVLLAAGIGLAGSQLRSRNLPNFLVLLLCLVLLPLAVCCLYVRVEWSRVHTLVLYSYVSLYVLIFLALEQLPQPLLRPGRDLVCLCLALITAVNISYANRCYMKLELQYENAYSLATTVVTQIRSLPDYRGDLKLAVYPSGSYFLTLPAELDNGENDVAGTESLLMGVPYAIGGDGQNDLYFYQTFIGANMPCATGDETLALIHTDEGRSMPCYPEPGSIRVIGDFVLVKFAENPYQ